MFGKKRLMWSVAMLIAATMAVGASPPALAKTDAKQPVKAQPAARAAKLPTRINTGDQRIGPGRKITKEPVPGTRAPTGLSSGSTTGTGKQAGNASGAKPTAAGSLLQSRLKENAGKTSGTGTAATPIGSVAGKATATLGSEVQARLTGSAIDTNRLAGVEDRVKGADQFRSKVDQAATSALQQQVTGALTSKLRSDIGAGQRADGADDAYTLVGAGLAIGAATSDLGSLPTAVITGAGTGGEIAAAGGGVASAGFVGWKVGRAIDENTGAGEPVAQGWYGDKAGQTDAARTFQNAVDTVSNWLSGTNTSNNTGSSTGGSAGGSATQTANAGNTGSTGQNTATTGSSAGGSTTTGSTTTGSSTTGGSTTDQGTAGSGSNGSSNGSTGTGTANAGGTTTNNSSGGNSSGGSCDSTSQSCGSTADNSVGTPPASGSTGSSGTTANPVADNSTKGSILASMALDQQLGGNQNRQQQKDRNARTGGGVTTPNPDANGDGNVGANLAIDSRLNTGYGKRQSNAIAGRQGGNAGTPADNLDGVSRRVHADPSQIDLVRATQAGVSTPNQDGGKGGSVGGKAPRVAGGFTGGGAGTTATTGGGAETSVAVQAVPQSAVAGRLSGRVASSLSSEVRAKLSVQQ